MLVILVISYLILILLVHYVHHQSLTACSVQMDLHVIYVSIIPISLIPHLLHVRIVLPLYLIVFNVKEIQPTWPVFYVTTLMVHNQEVVTYVVLWSVIVCIVSIRLIALSVSTQVTWQPQMAPVIFVVQFSLIVQHALTLQLASIVSTVLKYSYKLTTLVNYVLTTSIYVHNATYSLTLLLSALYVKMELSGKIYLQHVQHVSV